MERNKVRKLVLYALFVALIFVLGLTPVGLIPLGFLNVTILCIPTIVGTVILGLKAGLVLGFFFGTASLLSALGISLVPQSGLAAMLLAENPFFVVLMCYIPRLLVPVVTYFVHFACTRRRKSSLAVIPAAICGSLTNTVFYLGLMLLFFVICGLDSAPVLAVIGGTGLIAGSLEAAAAALIATPVVAALSRMGITGNKD